MTTPELLIVDLFCGAGGTTIGFEMTEGVAKVIAAVNHDPKAIESHWANHPEVKHFEEDIRTLDLTELIDVVHFQRKLFPNAKLVLWASLECTNFSKAKGGQPRDADSRTLADHLHRYIEAITPDAVMIENVVEFMSWGPLDKNGKPVSRDNGRDWLRWRKAMCKHGYRDEWKQMNSADFGARTSRNRLFGIFAAPDFSISWPEPSHAKNPSKGEMFSQLKKWEPCRPCLDLEDHGTSIFTPKKIKSDKTFERILAGLIKYVAGMGQKEFISKYFSGDPWSKNASVESPAGSITTSDHHSIVQAEFMVKWRGHNGANMNGSVADLNEPSPTVTTMNHLGIASAEFLMKYNSAAKDGNMEHAVNSVDSPAPTIPAQRQPNIVSTEYLLSFHHGDNLKETNVPAGTVTASDKMGVLNLLHTHYSNSDILLSTETAAPTIPCADVLSKVDVQFLDRQFTSGGQDSSIEEPHGSVLPVPKSNLVTPILIDTQFNNAGKSIDEPAPTITANRKWHYLMNPQYMNNGGSINNPSFTLIARMDKMPPYLVQAESGQVTIEVYESDTDVMRKIKYFMSLYGIVDIKMRMLKVSELKKIQGFPEDYILKGNQSDQKKFIGNSVVPHVVKAWTLALVVKLREREAKAA